MKQVRILPLVAVTAMLLAIPAMQAQQKGRMSHMMYNASTETTIQGTIENVMQGSGAMGTHLTVKTSQGNMDVVLGPSNFLNHKGVTFAKGNQVYVIGSKVMMGGTATILAREITTGGATLTLRDKNGKPEWNGMMHGKQTS
jgi:hypothetical protein